ncbi:hypothetical protein NZY91_001913 [Campylobacter coli]|nr:hypothetical protein [Campylobacter coli]
MPLYPECKEFVQFYYDLYEKIGNEIDNSGEFERYKMQKKNPKKHVFT